MTRVEGFAAIPNWMIRDESISLYAVAVYAALASHTGPGGIHPSWATLAKESRCSRRSVASALNELEGLGVVERVRRTSKQGRASTGYTLHPNGHLAADETREEVSAPDAPTPLVSAPGARGKCTTQQVVPYIEEEPIKKNLSIVSPSSNEMFEAAWKHWPRKENKKKAREKFARLKNQVEVAAAIVEHGDAHAKYSGVYVPHLISWLNGSRWEEAAPGPRGAKVSTVEHGRSVDEILAARESEMQAVGR